jgi:hypothetical protein
MTVRVRGLVALWCLLGVGGVVRAADVGAEVGLQRVLDQPFNLTLTKTPLSDAFKQIAATAKISMQVDPACYDLLPYGATTLVSADFRQSKLRDAIEEVLVPLGLQQAVSGATVIVRPSGPLSRIGRRAYWEELKLLQDLRNTEVKAGADGGFDFKTAVRAALDRPELVVSIADEGVSGATRDKALDQIKKQLPMSAFRSLEMYGQLTGQIWFVEAEAGAALPGASAGTVRVMSMKAWMQRQMERPIQVDFTNAPLNQVVAELTHLSGIRFVPEPGLYQMVPVISLKSNNGSVIQTLEALAGGTRIAFDVREDSILLHMAGNEPLPAPRADAIVGRISVPVGTGADRTMIDMFIRESDLPRELNEMRKKKTQEAIDAMARSWEGSPGEPAAVPATAPAANTQPGAAATQAGTQPARAAG